MKTVLKSLVLLWLLALPFPARSTEIIAFNDAGKTVTLRDPLMGHEREVATSQLSLRERQRLLLSPFVLNEVKADEGRSATGRRLLLQGAGVVAVVMVIAFAAVAWLFVRRANLALALFGALGAWILVALLSVFYLFLKQRLGGGIGYAVLGAGVAMTMGALFVAAVYNSTMWRGLLVLLFHPLVGAALLLLTVAVVEMAAGAERVGDWWNAHVFEPLGIVEAVRLIEPP